MFILRQLGFSPLIVLLMLLIGVVLVTLGAFLFLRRLGTAPSPLAALRGPSLAFVPGVLFLVLVVVLFATNPHLVVQLIRGDFEDASRINKVLGAELSAQPPSTKDWPQWRGPNRDGISAETGLNFDWTNQPPKVLWRVENMGSGYSSVAVAGGKVYHLDLLQGMERVVCLDAETGKQLWVHRYPLASDVVMYDRGPRATATIHDGRVYVVGSRGAFLCLEAAPADGQAKVLWQHDLMQQFGAAVPDWGVACSPLIEGDLVIVQPGGARGSIVAFDRRSGQHRWSALSDPSGYSSPMAATLAGTRQIVCLTALGVVGLHPADGRQLWYYDWTTPYRANIATPIVVGDYVFISTDYSTGCVLLEVSADGPGQFQVNRVWEKRDKLMRNHIATCVLHQGHLYGYDTAGKGGLALLTCIDLARGRARWSDRSVGRGCLLLVDNHFLVLSDHGTLALVEATPEEYRQKGKVPDLLKGGECWAPPALVDGRLYLRDHEQVVCVDLRK